ncbi:MAG: hypothetical protein ACYSX0_05530 [Planctomycetota bacterium]
MNMKSRKQKTVAERGTILLVVLFVATAIAALAAVGSGRVVAESRQQQVLEDSSRASNEAYAQLHLALNVVNNSAYDMENHNLEIRAAIDGDNGGTSAGETDSSDVWLHDPNGVEFGFIKSTGVRTYRARDYIKRLAKLKGETVPTEIDPTGESDNFFVLESLGRAGDTVRVISALVRENEPFSSFVFFQNRHPLGVSGAPRGLIHANEDIHFYFPNGMYVDGVSAVDGFAYQAGATPENTGLMDANPSAAPINLEAVDFAALKGKADLFVGQDGLDAEIRFYSDGQIRIREYTPPHWEIVTYERTGTNLVGYDTETYTDWEQVQTGTESVEKSRQVLTGHVDEIYFEDEPIYEWQEVTLTRQDPIYEPQLVDKTRQEPIYERQLVTRTRWVQVFVPYDSEAGGGTAVGGGSDGVPGEYVWQQEEYQNEEDVLVGWDTIEYQVEEDVLVGYDEVTWTEMQQVQTGTQSVEKTRQVPVYETEIYYEDEPIYEWQEIEKTKDVPVYEEYTYYEDINEFFYPQEMSETFVTLSDAAGTIYIDGRITELEGDLNGRVTVVGNEKVRITDSIRYVDDEGDTAMLNGDSYTQPYQRNSDYAGDSTLGVIARDDVVLTGHVPDEAEINGTLMSTTGRVGIDGFAIRETGEPTTDYYYGLTDTEQQIEENYDRTSYRTTRFAKDSLRRVGGIISNDRILETYIRNRSDGTSYVHSGFKRGRMKFDVSLLFNPPPNFVEVPRPVVTYYAPVFFMRGED